MPLRQALRKLSGALTALVVFVGAFQLFDPLPAGLRATYTSSASQTVPEPQTDGHPSTASLVAAWNGQPPPAFAAAWTGSVLAARTGTFTFATNSDDGSMVFVDGRKVVDNGGSHEARLASGTVDLAAGVHAIQI